ncbi:MAG: hypothetical protein M0Z49_01540 [Chloroflexi bacterium]|nr:hypothetical protein [Chloroflexota bacterium]
MSRSPTDATGESYDDVAPIARFPWLTQRHLVFFVIGWLILFSIGSVFVSNPFASETSASANIDYWHVMYLHGLLVGMVGLLALLTCGVLQLRSMHTRMWIVGGVLFMTVLTAVGGIFDRRVPGAEVAMWVQIFGFFALDEICIVLLLGMLGEWRSGAPNARTLPYVSAFLAAGSMFVAAVMGHLAGWILEFGNSPSIIGTYASAVGDKIDDFEANLVGSHSHDMVVAVMALSVSIAAVQFGYHALHGRARSIAQLGLALVAVGVVLMTVMYVVMAFTSWGPPTLFQSADGTNGIAGDDIVTGVFVMLGGLITLIAVVIGDARMRSLAAAPVRLATLWAWVLLFATVVIAGYSIELNETYFGAGDKAPGAANDAVFTWLHQDLGLFLMPALVLVMLAVARFVVPRHQGTIGWVTIAGTTVTFLGGMLFVFVNPALHGPGYDVSAVGLLVVGIALLATMWYGALSSAGGLDAFTQRRPHAAGGHGR